MKTLTQIAAASVLALLSGTSLAAEMPKPCGDDARERCIDYRDGQIVYLVLSPGQTTTIQLPDNETVYFLGVSDNGVIRGEQASSRAAAGNGVTADPNLETSVPGEEGEPSGFVTLKAKRVLEPQSFLVIGEWKSPVTGKVTRRRHTFEIHTTQPDSAAVQVGLAGSPAAEGGFYSLVFKDPVAEKEARAERARKRREEQDASTVKARLEQVQVSTLRRNVAYDGQGTEADRASLAPSAPPGLDAMWDDGQRTYLRYPGNRGSPRAYEVLADGTEALIGQNTVVDPATKGSLLIVHRVVPFLRLRDEGVVLCITNNAYDPVGVNTGTGTVDPGIVRDVKGP